MSRFVVAHGIFLFLSIGWTWTSGQIMDSDDYSFSDSDEFGDLIPFLEPRWGLGNHGPFQRPQSNVLCTHGHFFPGCKWQGGRPRPRPGMHGRWELGNHGPFKRPNANILCKHGHFFPGCKWQGGRPRPTMFGRTFGLFDDIFGSWLGGGSNWRPLPGPGFDLAPAKPKVCSFIGWRGEQSGKGCEGSGPHIIKPPPPPRPTKKNYDHIVGPPGPGPRF